MTPPPVVIRDCAVVAPPAAPRRHATVIVHGDRISAVLPDSKAVVEGPATVVDGSGRYLIPGLVDMHVHFHRDDAVNKVIAALLLAHGVTTAFCMHGTASVLRLREAIGTHGVLGPSVLSTGPIQNDSGLTFALGRRRAADQRRRGLDAVKVYNELSREGFDGLCGAARELGMPVVGHIVRSVGAEATLGSYQSLIAHAEEFVYAYFGFSLQAADDREADKLRVSELPRLADAAAAADLTLVATLQHFSAIMGQAGDIRGWMSSPEMSLLPDAAIRKWVPGRNMYASRFDQPHHLRRLREAADFQSRLVREFHRAGVRVLAGTDALATGSVPGVSLHRELSLLADAGLPDAQVLEAATAGAAAYLGRDLGRIEAGAPADLVLLSDDPTRGISGTRSVTGVMTRGRWFAADTIWAEHAAALAECQGSAAGPTGTGKGDSGDAAGDGRPGLGRMVPG
jgi:hypothetical protein